MTELPDPLPLTADDDVESGASRRHALWALVVLGCLAVTVGCLMVLLGGGGKTRHAANILPPVQTPASSPHHSVGAQSTSRGPHSAASSPAETSSSASPTGPAGVPRHGNPCASSSTCVVDGDGGALAAVNAYRTSHGLAAVTGGVSPNAQTCAQNKGSGPTCVPHYAWTALPAQNGAKAVAKIAAFGSDWLLDSSTQTVSVGWAYVDGQYECVLLKAP
ncbi:MAG TPA: hypothetical protein VFT67_12505 [Jatrophihabitantaceae bacterium]|nr:hypothetical protein [Jatrophihabitantaceae bacterium]